MKDYDYSKTLWFLCMEMIDTIYNLSGDEALAKHYSERANQAYAYDEERRKNAEKEFYDNTYYAERGI